MLFADASTNLAGVRALMLLFVWVTGCEGPAAPVTLTVHAAASTVRPVMEAARRFEASRGGAVRVSANFAPSPTLSQQIERGARADLFISADRRWIERLVEAKRATRSTLRTVARNELVMVTRRGERFEVKLEPGFDLAGSFAGRLAVADPEHVPAGLFAREALLRYGWWEKLQGRILFAADAQAAVRLLEMGEARSSIVYRTDVLGLEGFEIVIALPSDSHSPIVYEAVLLEGAIPEAVSFLDFLCGAEGVAIFKSCGFQPVVR